MSAPAFPISPLLPEIVRSLDAHPRLVLEAPYLEASESNVRAKVTKAVGRPADVYSLGADGREGGEGNDADLGNWQA